MTSAPHRLALFVILVLPLLMLGPLRAQEASGTPTPAATPEAPTGSTAPAAPDESAEEGDEVVLPEGENLSADNNLSFPVDI